MFPKVKLRRQRLIADDRSRHQVGEQRHEGREIRERFGRGGVPTVEVDDVGQRMEGVEGDADGQHHAQDAERLRAHQRQQLVRVSAENM